MKLWVLRPVDENSAPWSPWYDKAFWFVVRAETESDARHLAHAAAGDENTTVDGVSPWLTWRYSTCVELLLAEETPGIVIRDFRAA